MPKGNCGLATEATTVLDMAEDEDRCHLTLLFQWDGVSVWPNCHGVLTSLTLTNWHDDDWEVLFDRSDVPGAEPAVITIPMAANSDQSFDAVLLAAKGLADLPDVGGVRIRAVGAPS